MRKKTLQQAIDTALARPAIETVHVVRVADWADWQAGLARLRLMLATSEAENGQLRMNLREALAQLERIHATSKTVSPDYRRLVKRSQPVLDRVLPAITETNEKDTPNEADTAAR